MLIGVELQRIKESRFVTLYVVVVDVANHAGFGRVKIQPGVVRPGSGEGRNPNVVGFAYMAVPHKQIVGGHRHQVQGVDVALHIHAGEQIAKALVTHSWAPVGVEPLHRNISALERDRGQNGHGTTQAVTCNPDFLISGLTLLHHGNQVVAHFPEGIPEAGVNFDPRAEFGSRRLGDIEVGFNEVPHLGGVTGLLLRAPKDNDDRLVVGHDNAIGVIFVAAGQVADEVELVDAQGPKAGFKDLLKLPLIGPIDAELIGEDQTTGHHQQVGINAIVIFGRGIELGLETVCASEGGAG